MLTCSTRAVLTSLAPAFCTLIDRRSAIGIAAPRTTLFGELSAAATSLLSRFRMTIRPVCPAPRDTLSSAASSATNTESDPARAGTRPLNVASRLIWSTFQPFAARIVVAVFAGPRSYGTAARAAASPALATIGASRQITAPPARPPPTTPPGTLPPVVEPPGALPEAAPPAVPLPIVPPTTALNAARLSIASRPGDTLAVCGATSTVPYSVVSWRSASPVRAALASTGRRRSTVAASRKFTS